MEGERKLFRYYGRSVLVVPRSSPTSTGSLRADITVVAAGAACAIP